jgi:hypothetical protein
LQSPFYSGRDLVEIEGDEAVLQAVESLVDLSRDFPDFVGWNIAHDLEALAKVSSIRFTDVEAQELTSMLV